MCGGQCNYYLGQYEEALAHYRIAQARDKEGNLTGLICYNKGLANASLMRYEEAIADQEASIGATPDVSKQAQAKFQLGVTLRRIANSQREGFTDQEALLDRSIDALKHACTHM